MKLLLLRCWLLLVGVCGVAITAAHADPLAVGAAGHAFDHLGSVADQAPAAAASGATILYATGFGTVGYQGLPGVDELARLGARNGAYVHRAKADGIRLAIGYVCATSIVKLENFGRNWTDEFRSQFASPPDRWLQQDRSGKPLPSWYGGDYRPACMSNPDWRLYERSIVRRQLEAGYDGIFFDNPTVHPQGCYCEHCMRKFAVFLAAQGVRVADAASTATLRGLAAERPADFLRFRCTLAADFLRDMRTYARSLRPDALVTCNNSLNSPAALFSQCRTYGYHIPALAGVEDWVVVEDMACQPRTRPDGSVVEYGPVYEILHAVSNGKPVVAVTLADAGYYTPPRLTRLAMAEAAAHGASYLSWPTWPEGERQRMIGQVRPEADLLRRNTDLLADATPAADVGVYLPFERWVESSDCPTPDIALALGRANLQFRVAGERDFDTLLAADSPRVLVVEDPAVLTGAQRKPLEAYRAAGGRVVWANGKGWLAAVQAAVKTPIVVIDGPAAVRAVVRRKAGKTIVHLLNLDVRKTGEFTDHVEPAAVGLRVRWPGQGPASIRAVTADPDASAGPIAFSAVDEGGGKVVTMTVPRLDVATMLVIE